MTLGTMITSGVDLWLNTPEPPMEASGTSGMKAAINGVPNLSVLDGWWIEGHIEGLTGWSIGDKAIHKKWGEGTVLEVSGSGQQQELKINFPGLGLKKVLAAIAPIEKGE